MKKAKKVKISRSLRIVRKFFPKVAVVYDASKPITIKVTKADNTASKKRVHNECALAVACKRTQHLDGVIVARSTAYLIKGTIATRYAVPIAGQKEIVAFDRGGGFAPGMYKLVKPQHQIGSHHGVAGNGKRTGEHIANRHHFTQGVRTALGSKEV